jgi:hypothetical protein
LKKWVIFSASVLTLFHLLHFFWLDILFLWQL